MKRRFILFLTLLAVTFCALALVVGADDIYTDFTKPGINGESPLFSFLGYSSSDEGNIAVGYKIHHDALESYEAKTGNDLKIGFVVTFKDFVDGTSPLDSDGLPTGENKEKILVVNFKERYDRAFATLFGVPKEMLDAHIIMSLFVVDNESVKYVGSETSEIGPESTSFNDTLQGLPPTPAVPPITEVTVDGITYSINGTTEPAWDRVRQQNNSLADYNTGSSLSSSQLTGFLGVKAKAQLIAAGGSLINMPAASALMSHYLKNTGETYSLDVASFLKDDSGALSSRNKAINSALRASEQLAQRNKAITVNQLEEGHPYQHELATQNWQYAIGSYFTDVDVINLTVAEVDGVKTYSADIKYIVTDYYNWDTNDYNEFKGIVSPHDLHELHKAGIAKEFSSYGEITYSITWTEGQTVDQIAGLN